ncbi:hypothetical protein [Jannaschia sp. CCS1]|uniref:hypothetical protein n=1 Tax=Jannaschia sp. (strain CCS1) TaxID=290400 RepID=UPI000053BA71|nr:hypothetical protein [Jannaschia sp. CCS1]ABD55621.1 hypothetical protein Jann_2704 [Jannaschia sp. CCS1]
MELEFLLFVVLLPLAAAGAVTFGVWVIQRYCGRSLGGAFAAIVMVLAIYDGWRVQNLCNGEPEFILPEPGAGGEGRVVFPCDGPAGFIAYAYSYWMVPIGVFSMALGAWLIMRRHKKVPA